MSTRHGPPIPQEDDRPGGRGIALVIGAAVLVSVGLAVLASVVLHSRIVESRWRTLPAAAAVGEVNQTLIGVDTSAAAHAGRKRRELEGYDWADGPGRVVRIPIERAMRIVAGEEP